MYQVSTYQVVKYVMESFIPGASLVYQLSTYAAVKSIMPHFAFLKPSNKINHGHLVGVMSFMYVFVKNVPRALQCR
jgi:hypothetical protein